MGCEDDISAIEADCARAPETIIIIPQASALGPPLINVDCKFLRRGELLHIRVRYATNSRCLRLPTGHIRQSEEEYLSEVEDPLYIM